MTAELDDKTVSAEPTADDVPHLQPARLGHIRDLLAITDPPESADPAEAAEQARQLEIAQRLLGDQKLRDALAQENFSGSTYARFEAALAGYGISVLRGWMQTGRIFKATAKLGFHLKPSEYELEELAHDSDVREELANMTVALTLPKFRERALMGGGWKRSGGAGLTTYFVGATLYVFPNELRQHRLHRTEQPRAAHAIAGRRATADDPLCDPALVVPDTLNVAEFLRGLSGRDAEVVALTVDGYSQEEIAELLHLPSVRAVEGILYRWRTKTKAMIKAGGQGDSR